MAMTSNTHTNETHNELPRVIYCKDLTRYKKLVCMTTF